MITKTEVEELVARAIDFAEQEFGLSEVTWKVSEEVSFFLIEIMLSQESIGYSMKFLKKEIQQRTWPDGMRVGESHVVFYDLLSALEYLSEHTNQPKG
jgi:hypothetical protein